MIETESHTPEAQQWEGWGTALKPAFEPIVVARKPLIGTVAQNVLEHGTGGLNIDGSRIGTEQRPTGLKKDGSRSQKVSEGWDRPWKNDERADRIVGERTTSQGRWPANVILDEYSAEILDEQSGVSFSRAGGRSTGRNFGQEFADASQKDRERTGHSDSGGASRFFYVAKASKTDRNEGLEELETKQTVGGGEMTEAGGAYGSIKAPAKNFHPTVKPTALMTYLVNLVTPPNGTVLDPFTGSGSTGKAAILAGFNFIGIELTEDYHPIIEGRLKHAEVKRTENQEKEGEVLF